MKIIFMGTPQFAVPAFEKIIANKNFEIIATYTKEPQISGRGQKVNNSVIHNLALKHNIKVITPKSLRHQEAIQEFRNFNADIAVVVAFGLILPKEILTATKYGCINIHPSLLPKWRGATPIQSTLLASEKESAVTIIKMDEGVDSGDIILQENISLKGDEIYSDLSNKMAEIGADLLIKSLMQIKEGQANFIKQDNNLASFSKKIQKSDCIINWNEEASAIFHKIKALSGYLTAYFTYKNEKIKIYQAKLITKNSEKKAGEIVDEKLFIIQCKNYQIQPLIVQREGKKIMAIEEFLRGFKF